MVKTDLGSQLSNLCNYAGVLDECEMAGDGSSFLVLSVSFVLLGLLSLSLRKRIPRLPFVVSLFTVFVCLPVYFLCSRCWLCTQANVMLRISVLVSSRFYIKHTLIFRGLFYICLNDKQTTKTVVKKIVILYISSSLVSVKLRFRFRYCYTWQ